MNNHPIGIFDSGVGGLSVLREVKKLLPHESILYLADQANVPYGNKKENRIIHLSERSVRFLIKKKVKMIIVACNTATVHSLDHLRPKYKIPIIGIVPVVKTAAEKTRNKRVGILSTIATAKSEYQKELIRKFASGLHVINIGTDRLVPYVERGELEGERLHRSLKSLLSVFRKENIDTLALGCSHFPFLKDEIARVLPPGIAILDSGAAIARQARRILEREGLKNSDTKNGKDHFYTTGSAKEFARRAEQLLGAELADVRHADL